jgi:hypothetical protein
VLPQACATIIRVLTDYLPRNKMLSYRAVVQEVEARTNLAARHYQTLVKRRRAQAVLSADPANAAAKAQLEELPLPETMLPVFYGSGKTCTEIFLLDHARFVADQVCV